MKNFITRLKITLLSILMLLVSGVMAVNYNIMSLLLSLVVALVYPALFIWAVNTLFGYDIPLTFKTWLASLVLFLTLRFFVNKAHSPSDYPGYESDYDDEDYDDEEEEDYDDDEEEEDDYPDPNSPHIRRIK